MVDKNVNNEVESSFTPPEKTELERLQEAGIANYKVQITPSVAQMGLSC